MFESMAIALTNKPNHSKSDAGTISDDDECVQEEQKKKTQLSLRSEVKKFGTCQLRSLFLRAVDRISIAHLLLGKRRDEKLPSEKISNRFCEIFCFT